MSLPCEKKRAVIWSRRFLRSLLVPYETPRVPRVYRQEASRLLRHFPYEGELDRMVWK